LYRTSFGLGGDWIYVALVSLWLSRHLFLRWIITRDVSTSKAPTFTGVMTHWISSLVLAGQYLDRPCVTNPEADAEHQEERLRQSISETIPSLAFTLQWFRLRIWYPVLQALNLGAFASWIHQSSSSTASSNNTGNGKTNNKNNDDHGTKDSSSGKRDSDSRRDGGGGNNRRRRGLLTTLMSFLQRLKMICWNLWRQYGPPPQLVFVMIVFGFCLWSACGAAVASWLQPQSSSSSSASTTNNNIQNNNLGNNNNNEEEDAPTGGSSKYTPLNDPSWLQVCSLVICGSTMACIIMYGRITLPIPDLVAGQNVLKAVRLEAKGSNAKDYSSGKSKHKHHKGGSSSMSMMSGMPGSGGDDVAWAEKFKPISYENRFRLATQVALSRMIDAALCCAILPRTPYICRATGHCPSNPTLWELSTILFPAGVTEAYRSDGGFPSAFAAVRHDIGSVVAVLVSIIVISGVLLMAQLVTLNKSYLAMMGYIAGEWKLVKNYKGTSVPPQWDPRRRYKKGDLIRAHHSFRLGSVVGGGGSVYMATSNSPEGRPFDLFLRATHDLFRQELGDGSTSRMIVAMARIQSVLITMIAALTAFYWMRANTTVTSLATTLVANIVALFGLVQVGFMDNRSELKSIAKEVSLVTETR